MAKLYSWSNTLKLFANAHDSTSWIKHANGLSQLVKFRGCDSYQTEFDHTLLKASRGLIVHFIHFLTTIIIRSPLTD